MSVAFVFPGQGSQAPAMLADLASSHPQIKEVFSLASEVLDYDLWDLVQHDDTGKINQTAVTQPAMLAAGMAVYNALKAQTDTPPAFFAGHSLGEYTALVAAGALDLQSAIKLVEQRGQLMQTAVGHDEGAMAAVLGLEDDVVKEVCVKTVGVVEAVNFNSPGQVVIAGHKQAVHEAMELASEAGASKVVLLPVSVPSHCSLMKPAADKLAETLAGIEFKMPHTPVLHNVNVQSASSAEEIKELLVKQLYQPVQWVKTIESMKAQGVERLYELGPGKVLMGLNRRIDRKMPVQPVFDGQTFDKALHALSV